MTRKNNLVTVLSCVLLVLPSASFAVEGYYSVGKERLEFRVVVVKAREAGDGWQAMSDVKGKWFLVSPKVQLDSQDIEGVRVQRSKGREGEYEIIIYFKKEAWTKVLGVTKGLIGKRLGIVREDKLISAPVVRGPIDRQAQVAGWLGLIDVKQFVGGFVLTDEPSAEEREAEYFGWLQQRVKTSRYDLDARRKLAFGYYYGGIRGVRQDYGKALNLFQELLQKDPTDGQYGYLIAACYVKLRQYDKAVQLYEKMLIERPKEEWNIRLVLAEAYKARGDTRNAVGQLEKSLKVIKAMPESSGYKDRLVEAIEKQLHELKESTN